MHSTGKRQENSAIYLLMRLFIISFLCRFSWICTAKKRRKEKACQWCSICDTWAVVELWGESCFSFTVISGQTSRRLFELSVDLKWEDIRLMLGSYLWLVCIIPVRQCLNATNQARNMSQRILLQLWACFFSLWPFQPSGLTVTWYELQLFPSYFINYIQNSQFWTSDWGSATFKARRPFLLGKISSMSLGADEDKLILNQ